MQIDLRRGIRLFGAADPRQRQHVVDELTHSLRAGADAAQVVLSLLVEALAVIFEQRQAEAVDPAAAAAPCRSCEDRVAEGLQLLVLVLELGDQGGADLGWSSRRGSGASAASISFCSSSPRMRRFSSSNWLAAKLRPHARLEHLEIAGFGDVVIGARAQPFDHRLAPLERGEHDEGGSSRDHRRRLDPAGRSPDPPRPGASARPAEMQSTGCTLSSSSASSPDRASTRRRTLGAQRVRQRLQVGRAGRRWPGSAWDRAGCLVLGRAGRPRGGAAQDRRLASARITAMSSSCAARRRPRPNRARRSSAP